MSQNRWPVPQRQAGGGLTSRIITPPIPVPTAHALAGQIDGTSTVQGYANVFPFITDTGVDTVGTLLSAHSPAKGGPWILNSISGTTAEISAGGDSIVATDGTDIAIYNSTTEIYGSGAVSWQMATTNDPEDIGNEAIAGMFSFSSSGDQEGFAFFYDGTVGAWKLGFFSGGSYDPIDLASATLTTGLGHWYQLTLYVSDPLDGVSDATVEGWVDGVKLVDGTYSGGANIGSAAVYFEGPAGPDGFQIRNINSSLTVPSGVPQALAGTIAGTSSVTGALTVAHTLAGTIAATSSVTGSLSVVYAMAGTIAGTSSMTGALRATYSLAGTIAGTSTVTGDLTNSGDTLVRRTRTLLGVGT